VCPFRDGQDCLGQLAPGTYHSRAFTPPITYTVPRGWSNDGDNPGDFMLVPKGSSPGRANADTGNSVGVFTSVVMDRSCSSRHPPPLAADPRA